MQDFLDFTMPVAVIEDQGKTMKESNKKKSIKRIVKENVGNSLKTLKERIKDLKY